MSLGESDYSLDVREATSPATDIGRQLFRNGQIGCIQDDIEICVMLFNGADDCGPRRRMEFCRTDIGGACRIGEDRLLQTFVVAFANEGKAFIFRATRVLSGEINWDVVTLEQLFAEILGYVPALLDGDVSRWVNFNGIDGANTGMTAVLLFHVDQFV